MTTGFHHMVTIPQDNKLHIVSIDSFKNHRSAKEVDAHRGCLIQLACAYPTNAPNGKLEEQCTV